VSPALESPRVAVIIPLYNLDAFVAEAIESALAQTLPPSAVEIIVVDDGSTDGGSEIARRYDPIRYVRQDNRGLSAARNVGLAMTRAPFVQLLDADDRLAPDKLERQLAAFDGHPEVGIVYAGWRYIDESGAPLPQHGWSRHAGDVVDELLLGNLLPPVAPLVRREAIERAGGFDETLTSLEDWDLWLRISLLGRRWAYVDAALCDYRVRTAGMHRDGARMHANRMRVVEKTFARPDLLPAVRVQRTRTFAAAQLLGACDLYRSGDAASGARAFRDAVAMAPQLLAGPRALRRIARSLLPVGRQSMDVLVREQRPVLVMLSSMLTDLFGAADCPPQIRRIRLRTRLAYRWLVVELGARRLRGSRTVAQTRS
jgi:glycosyltransferase involved in cell wall biosynthesis